MYICALLLVALALTLPVIAQEPSFRFGATIGAEGGVQSTAINVYDGSPDCGVFKTGYGLLPMFGATVVFPTLFGERAGVSLTAGASAYTGRFTTPPVDPVRIVDDVSGQIVSLDREFRMDHDEWGLAAELLGRIGILPRVTLAVGPTFGYRFTFSSDQTDNILGPGDYRFPDGQPTHGMPDRTPLSIQRLDVGAIGQLLYDIPLAKHTLLQPGVVAHATFGSPVEQADWQRLNVGARLSLLFDLPPNAVIDTPPPVVPPALRASVDIMGLDYSNNPIPLGKVRVSELVARQIAPLLPAVFFDSMASVLPDRYHLRTPSEADSFSINQLAGISVLEIQHHTLDIVGIRMRRNPTARLYLFGSVSKDEPGTVSRPRATWARDYLVSVWKIDPKRLVIRDRANFMDRSTEATEDGRADNRRVEMASDNPAILAPVVTEQVEREFSPPAIRMSPYAHAEAGVRLWELVLKQGEKIVARYDGDDEQSMTGRNFDIGITDGRLSATMKPVEVQLRVEDEAGGTVTVADTVEMQLVRRVRFVDGRIERTGNLERISYTFVGFEFDRTEMGVQNEQMIRDIAELTRPGAKISITGYTDRIGDRERNDDLSIERASAVETNLRRALGPQRISEVTINTVGLGVETERFTNDIAEGRVLSRGVHILIEQESGEE